MFMEKSHNERVTNGLKEFANKMDWMGPDNPETFIEENLCKFDDANNLRIVLFSLGEEPGYEVTHLRNAHMNQKYKKTYPGHYIDHFFLIIKLNGFINCGHEKTTNDKYCTYVCGMCYSYFLDRKH